MCKANIKKPGRKGGDKRRDSSEYWERRLKKCGLSMERGCNENRILYGHDFGRGGLDFDGVTVYGMSKEKQRGERIVQSGEEGTAGKASGR